MKRDIRELIDKLVYMERGELVGILRERDIIT